MARGSTVAILAVCLFLCTSSAVAQLRWLGQVFSPTTSTTVPPPVAFYPLTDGGSDSVISYPDGVHIGTANFSVTWQPTSPFGNTIPCNKLQADTVLLDPVTYADTGNFTVSFWFIADPKALSGTDFGYLFSTRGNVTRTLMGSNDSFAANQINVYLPQNGHPAYGMVRTSLKDDTDLDDQASFVDSDDTINNNLNRTGHQSFINVADGLWHMYTLTSHPDQTDGYLVYIDGLLAAQAPGLGGTVADGGDPIQLNTADIFLCSRADGNPARHFTGSITHLALWNGALSASQVADVFQSVPQPIPGLTPDASSVKNVLTVAGRRCIFPYQFRDVDTSTCTKEQNGGNATYCYDDQGQWNQCSFGETISLANIQTYLDKFINDTQLAVVEEHVQLCSANSSMPELRKQDCPLGFTCAALAPWILNSTLNSSTSSGADTFTGDMLGVCAKLTGVYYPDPLVVAPPSYFFPLTGYNTHSWPLPDSYLWNTSVPGTSWAADHLFGSVVQCSNTLSEAMAISHLTWGQSGTFAFNLWFSQTENRGNTFQYLLSARQPGLPDINDTTIFLPNQMHVYLPGAQHPVHGLVRAVVKDSTDAWIPNATNTWLDSDGWVGSNDYRTTSRMNFTDNAWHMLTVTTVPGVAEGYQIWIDGILKAIASSTNEFSDVDGGRPIFTDSDLIVCGRSDKGLNRYFDGKVAHLSIFDYSLDNTTIGTLYQSVTGVAPLYIGPPPPPGPAVPAAPVAAAQVQSPPPSAPRESPEPAQADSSTSPALQNVPHSPPAPLLFPAPPFAPVQASQGSLDNTATQNSRSGDTSSGSSGSSLSNGAIAGIVVAALVGSILLGSAVTFFLLRRTPSWQKPPAHD